MSCFLPIAEVEFLNIAEKIKPHTARRMKIEPFPWLQGYYVDMRKLYTKLTLEKMDDSLLFENTKNIKNYIEMFQSDYDLDWETEEEYSADESSLGLEINDENYTLDRKKILLKADAGMGKTTLEKKMGFDWARGIFKKYSVVFFVHLNLVKPGDPIEYVIIQQHPELEGLNLSARKIRSMLERFGGRCLLILDGLDEHGLGKNEDVMKIIENRKLLDL